MTKIIASGDCGNSPKNQLLEKLAIALALGNVAALELLSADVDWQQVGQTQQRGHDAVQQHLAQIANEPIAELQIEHVVNHGKAGAVNGSLRYTDNRCVMFCHMFEFSNAKGTAVKQIRSYLIEMAS
jgi:hypothetical protein